MALKVNVSGGKPDAPRTSAGLIKRPVSEETHEKPAAVSISDIVRTIFDDVRTTLEHTADVELEFTANIEIITKDGEPTLNLDISGESGNARTMRLKFVTKVNPTPEKDKEKAS